MAALGDQFTKSAIDLGRRLREAVGGWIGLTGAAAMSSDRPAEPVARFRTICISRETGSGASKLGRLVSERLGWDFYDEEIVRTIAERMEVPVEQVRMLDELSPSVVQDWLLPLREEHYAPLEAYLDHLAKLVLALGKAGESVIVGRGAGFMIPRSEILHVRLVAPLKARASRLADREGISMRTAKRMVRDLDHRHDKFLRTMFRVDPTDPHQYDLVIDTESMGLPIAAAVIAAAVEAGIPVKRPIAALPAPANWPRPNIVEGASGPSA